MSLRALMLVALKKTEKILEARRMLNMTPKFLSRLKKKVVKEVANEVIEETTGVDVKKKKKQKRR